MSRELNNAIEQLKRFEELDESQFIPADAARLENIIPPVRAALALFKSIKPEYLSDLPERWLQSPLADNAGRCAQLLSELRKHKDASDYDAHVAALQNNFRGMVEHLYNVLAYCNCRNDNYADTKKRIDEIFIGYKEFEGQLAKRMYDLETKSTSLIARLEEVSLAKAVTQQATFFQSEVDRHKDLAAQWLNNTKYSLAALILTAIASFFIHLAYDSKDSFTSVQLVVSKILLIGVLTYITVQCAKNYYAHCHMREINQHRHNAILSYENFLDASGELEVRAAIVSYVAAAVFTPQDTGFVASPISFEAPKNLPELIVKTTTAATGTGGH